MSYYILANGSNPEQFLSKVRNMSASFENQFREVEDWVASKGYSVVTETDAEDRVEWADKTIYINSRNRIENRYYTLLHECGHIWHTSTILEQESKGNPEIPWLKLI